MESDRQRLKAKLKEFREHPDEAKQKLRQFRSADENYQHVRALLLLSSKLKKQITKTIFPLSSLVIVGTKEDVPRSHMSTVFYSTNSEVRENESNGISKQIECLIRENVSSLLSKSAEELDIAFKFDSHENVLEKAGGNYQMYMS